MDFKKTFLAAIFFAVFCWAPAMAADVQVYPVTEGLVIQANDSTFTVGKHMCVGFLNSDDHWFQTEEQIIPTDKSVGWYITVPPDTYDSFYYEYGDTSCGPTESSMGSFNITVPGYIATTTATLASAEQDRLDYLIVLLFVACVILGLDLLRRIVFPGINR